MLPAGFPADCAASLTKIVVEATLPDDGVSDKLPTYPEPIFSEISYPAGGVIAMGFVNPLPLTVND